MAEQKQHSNLATCYDGDRTYIKDQTTGRMYTSKDMKIEIDKDGQVVKAAGK